MSKTRIPKWLLLTLKLVIAAVLLAWAFRQVHWRDYVVARDDGKTYAVTRADPFQSAPRNIVISTGLSWQGSQETRPDTEFQPIPGSDEVIRQGMATSLRRIRIPLLVLAFGGFLLTIVITSIRWWFLLRLQDVRIGLWESLRLTFLGQFFNYIVPGTVGGDLVKAYYVSRHTHRKAAALVSVFVDRVLGLTELSLLAAVMIAVVLVGRLESFDRIRLPLVSISVVLVIVALTLAFLLSSRFRRVFHLQKLYGRLPIAHHIAALGEAALTYRRRIKGLAKAILITFGAHVVWVGSISLLGMSLGLRVPVYNYFVYIPLIYILGAVPITPGGVGLIESFYVQFLQTPLCGPSEILALAFLARIVPMFWGLPGAVVAVTGPRLPKAEDMQVELGLDDAESK